MSRYSQKAGNFVYAWGFDQQMGEYFFSKEDVVNTKEDGEENYIFSISNYYTMIPHPDSKQKYQYTTADIISIMTAEMKENPELRINPIHIERMFMDIPF